MCENTLNIKEVKYPQDQVIVNLSRKEFIDSQGLGIGLTAWSQASGRTINKRHISKNQIDIYPSTPQALFILLLASNADNFGDIEYQGVFEEEKIFGRWAGDKIAVVGELAKDNDLEGIPKSSELYFNCTQGNEYTDVSPLLRTAFSGICGIRYEQNENGFWYFDWNND
jgi:hypothetical protein